MRVLAIVNNFPWPVHPYDGMFNLRALLALQERGHDVRVVRIVPLAPPLKARWHRYRSVPVRYDVEGISVRTLRGLMAPRSLGIGSLALQLHSQMADLVEEFNPEIIHAHGLLPAAILGMKMSKPFVVTAHGSEAYRLPHMRRGLTALAQRVLQRADAVAAVSRFTASHLQALGRDDVAIIHNGADHRIFSPTDRAVARRALDIAPARRIVLFVGHLEREKGLLDLTAALALCADKDPLAVFAGTGSQRDRAIEVLERAGVEYRMLGAVDQPRLATLYAAADVVALPSYNEGLPTVICEAMCSGRVVIATPVGGIPEIISDQETGVLVPVGDPAALARALRVTLAESTWKERIQRAAAAFAREHLTWHANASAYEALYERVYGKTTYALSAGI